MQIDELESGHVEGGEVELIGDVERPLSLIEK
jgi:hypothetical protein